VVSAIVPCPSCTARNRVPVAATGGPRCARCHVALPWLVDADDEQFGAAVGTSRLVIVDLWAAWCGPCRVVAPILERLAFEFAGRLKVVKVDVDRSPGIAQRYRATSIPMLLFMLDGAVVETIVGAQPEHVLRAHIERLLADRPTNAGGGRPD
jgi:thioredoxin 2